MQTDERVTDGMVLAHAKADAIFAGTEFNALGRADRSRYLERSRAALSAALSEQTLPARVEIKPLEWKHHPDVWHESAMCPMGGLYVAADDGWRHTFSGPWHKAESFEAAKAAAQQDYETRIRAALVDVPAVEPEPVAWEVAFTANRSPSKGLFYDLDSARSYAERHDSSVITALYAHPHRSALVDNSHASEAVVETWQPIETAPKDGTPIDLWGVNHLHPAKIGRRATNVTWGRIRDWMGNERDDWQHGQTEDFEPTHWMHSPAPPALSSLRPAEVGSASSSSGAPDE